MIRFEQVSKHYPGGHQALQKVSFHLQQGEMAFLTGHSGAGKSTLLKLIAVMERPSDGRISFHGHDVSRIARRDIPYIRRQIGMIFQDHRLLLDRSVFDNVALPLIIDGFTPAEVHKRVSAALDKVGLHDKAGYLPMMLSGGEQQRVGIARAIVNTPPLLLADEPTGNLDTQTASEVFELFRKVNKEQGCAILLVTHDPRLSVSCDRTIKLVDGLIQSDTRTAPADIPENT